MGQSPVFSGKCRSVTKSFASSLAAGLLFAGAAQAQTYACDGRADLWFLNDESGSVDPTEWGHSKSFLTDVAADFDFDSATGFQGSLWAWSNNTVTRISPSNDSYPSVVASYTRAGRGSTYPGVAMQAVAAQVTDTTEVPPGSGVTDDGRRVTIPQIVVLLTDADGDFSVTRHPGGIRDGSLLVSSANSIRASGGEVIVYAIAEAAGRYDPTSLNYEPSFKTLLDNTAGSAANVIVGSSYAEIALDPIYVNDLTTRICSVAATLAPATPEVTGDMSATITSDTGPAGLSAGDTVTYSITVTNTGDVDLTGADIQSLTFTRANGDPLTGLDADDFLTTDSTTLAPTESAVFTASYVVTQADIDGGGLINSARVVGTPPTGPGDNVTDITDDGDDGSDGDDAGTDPTDDPVELLVSPAPELTVTQTIASTDPSAAGDPATWNPGDQITFTVEVVNTGNVTVSDMDLTGPLLPADVALAAANTTDSTPPGVTGIDTGDDALAPGEAWTYTYVYAVTQADIDAGEVLSTVNVAGDDPGGDPVSDDSDGDGDPGADSPRDGDSLPGNDPNVATLPQGPELTVRKTVDDSAVTDGVDVGDRLTYDITVQNTGNVTLSSVVLTDLFEDGNGDALALDEFRGGGGSILTPVANPDGSASYPVAADLAPGDSWTFTASYALTADVIETGAVENMVTVAATPPVGAPIEAESRVVDNTSRDGDGVPTDTGFPGAIEGQVIQYRAGLDGIAVRLIDEADGRTIDTTTTASGGYYEFVNIPPGTYTIEFDNPDAEGAEPTAMSADYPETANRITGIEVNAGEVEIEQNAFLVDPSGVVYDAETFAPVSGATVTLLFDGTPVPNAWLDGTLGDLNNVVTGADGAYAFLLDPAVAQNGVYSLEISHPGYVFESALIPATAGPYAPALGGGAEQISANAVPVSGMVTTYYLAFNLTFDPGSAAGTSNGVVRNHIPLDADLGLDIEEDLLRILEDDLAATMTQLGQQMEGYASGALDRLKSRDHLACLAQVNDLLSRENILFDTDKATIRPESDPVLDEIAGILAGCGGGSFEVAGHTDSRASDAYNLRLSKARADAVIAALADRGVVTEGFIGAGYGERRPIAGNDTAAGMARNRRVEFRLIDDTVIAAEACGDTRESSGSGDLSANDAGVTFAQDFRSESYDCRNDSWAIVEGRIGYLRTDAGISQTLANLSYRRERFVDLDKVRGYFIGLYGTQNDITGLAEGDIRGLGLSGGLYGANRLTEGLYLDYYLGAAAGRHDFDLDFDRMGGVVNADGNYTYVAGFVGTAVSGRTEWNSVALSPRAGFDLAYSPGGDVDLTTSRDTLSQSTDLRLGSVNGGRLFAEVGIELPTQGGIGSATFVPRIACYQSIGSLDGTCGIGGSLDLVSQSTANGYSHSLRFDGERGSDYSLASLSLSFQKSLWGGVLRGDAAMSENGDVSLVQQFLLNF